jgi:replication-associated recombination protein RarA
MMWNRLRVIASEDVGIANPIAPLIIDVLANEYKTTKAKKNDDSHRLFLVNAVLFLAKCPKSRLVDDLLITVYGNTKFKHERLEIPDYAIDIHTLRGKMMGRGYKHFFEIGAQLSNEAIEDIYKETAKQIVLKYGMP